MLSKTVVLLALSASAFARPKAQHHHHHRPSSSSGIAASTGSPFDTSNATDSSTYFATGTGSAVTMTVVSVSASSVDTAVDESAPASTVESSEVAPVATTFATSKSSSSASDLSLSVTSSVAAGGFYQRSSAVSSAASASAATSAVASSAAGAVSTQTSSAATTSSTASTGTSSGQRGLAFNDASLTSAFSGKSMAWAYNWGSAPGGTILSGLEYVPMLWGTGSDHSSGWSSAAASAISSGSKHLLSFNEPDLPSQSNLSPAAAAAGHIQYMNPFAGQAAIGSPAITNGAGTSPPAGTDWLSSFFSSCAGKCKVDFVAFHWYESATNIAYFQSHVQDVIDTAAANGVSKVWLTEFGASGTDAQIVTFLETVLPWLDSQPAVERYSYFMCSSIMVSGSSLNTIGSAFAA